MGSKASTSQSDLPDDVAVVANACALLLRPRLRGQRASGIPCASYDRGWFASNNSDALRRENADSYSPSLREAQRRSNPGCRRGGILDCFASLAMTARLFRTLTLRRPGQAKRDPGPITPGRSF